MTEKECVKWLKIIKVNEKNFPSISPIKKIEALETAIEIIERNIPDDNNDDSSNNV